MPNRPIGNAISDTDYSDEERQWLLAVERFRREHRVQFPSAVDLLRLARAEGYRKVAPPDPAAFVPRPNMGHRRSKAKPPAFVQNPKPRPGRKKP